MGDDQTQCAQLVVDREVQRHGEAARQLHAILAVDDRRAYRRTGWRLDVVRRAAQIGDGNGGDANMRQGAIDDLTRVSEQSISTQNSCGRSAKLSVFIQNIGKNTNVPLLNTTLREARPRFILVVQQWLCTDEV